MKTSDSNKDFDELMQILTVPRLNGTPALKRTRQRLVDWLAKRGIESHLHTFQLFPYFMEIGGAWIIFSQLFLAWIIWSGNGWLALPVALIAIAIPVLETRGTHVLSRFAKDTGENIVIEFDPPDNIEREIILTAHYDSKTEPFSEKWRTFFMRKLPIASLIALLLGVIGTITAISNWQPMYWFGTILTVPQLMLFIPLGINFVGGRFAPASQGALDNGGSCVVLLTLAEQIASKQIQLSTSKITLVLFCGEEVIIQGSRAYVLDRSFPYPTYAINLELIGQNGDFLIWKKIGSAFESFDSDEALNVLLKSTTEEISGTPVKFSPGPAGTDSLPFLKAGIPATSLSSLDQIHGLSGLHTPADNLTRISHEKLVETSVILQNLLSQLGTRSDVPGP